VVIIVCSALVLSIMMGVALLRGKEAQTVSQVTAEIRDIILQPSIDGFDNGGIIGPWHVAATHYDERTRQFHDFRLRSGAINLAASRATLTIDATRDSFSFTLHDVVIMRVPSEHEKNDAQQLIPLKSFLLGPAKYHRRIIADEAQ
jgi:hypothetical protein